MLLFNNIDLEQIVKVISIETTLMSDRENFDIDIPSRNGKLYNGFQYKEKEIVIKCDIKRNSEEEYRIAKDELSNALKVEEPKELYIDDSGRFFFAVSEGEISLERICEGFYRLKITFICYDPYAYNEEAKQYDGGRLVVCSNEGNDITYPIIDIGISKPTHFIQVENISNKKKILIGQYPQVGKNTVKDRTIVLQDACESTTDWIPGSTSVDTGRSANGTLSVTATGAGIRAGDYGSKSTGATWYGTSARKNLNTQIEDFFVEVNMSHNSTGISGDPTVGKEDNETATSGSKTTYYQVTATSLNVRSGAGTSYKRIGSLKKGTKVYPSTISKGWAKITYNGATGYVYTTYLKKYVSDTTATATKKNFMANKNTAIRSTYKLSATNKCTIGKGKIVRCYTNSKYLDPTDTEKKRYYYKLAEKYNNQDGYVLIDDLTDMGNVAYEYEVQPETADDKTGLVELYGYTVNNEKLFRIGLYDDNEWYEFTYPLVQVGSQDFLKDKTVAPSPKTKTTIEGDSNKLTVTKDTLLSGKYGDWNEFYGKLIIMRKNNKWSAWIFKIKDGTTTKQIANVAKQVNGGPTGNLAYIVAYFATSADSAEKASGVSLSHVLVKNLNPVNRSTQNVTVFEQGDNLRVDCYNNMVYLNNKPCYDIDIGSQFFPLEVGDNAIKISSDDTDISTSVIYNERWL